MSLSKIFARFLLLGVAVAAMSATSHAALIAYEGFDYATGNLSGQSGGIGWANNWSVTNGTATVTSSGLNYPGLESGGNKATIASSDPTLRTLATGLLGTGITADSTVWLSFIGRKVTNPSTRGVSLTLYNTTTADNRILIGIGNSDALGNWRAELAGGVGVLQSNTQVFNETLLLARIDYHSTGFHDFYLWTNPDLSSEPTTLSSSFVGSNIGNYDLSFDIVSMRVRTGSPATTAVFDEIRVATTFAEVVPEPNTYALFGFGLVGLAMIRKRRVK